MPRTTTKAKPDPFPAGTVGQVTAYWPPVKTFMSDGSVLIKPGKPVVLTGADEIGTREASKILGCTPDWVARLCDMGKLVEGREWRRIGDRGNFKIKRAAVFRLRSEGIDP